MVEVLRFGPPKMPENLIHRDFRIEGPSGFSWGGYEFHIRDVYAFTGPVDIEEFTEAVPDAIRFTAEYAGGGLRVIIDRRVTEEVFRADREAWWLSTGR